MNTVKKSQSESKSGRVKSFPEYLSEIQEQTEIYQFDGTEEKPLAEELCNVMAKVMCLPDGFKISVNSQKLDAVNVREVFKQIRYKHICHVIDKFSNIDYPVKHITSYLRTALYNSVDEAEHSIVNEVNRWMKNDK